MRLRRLANVVFVALCAAVTVASFVNVYGDNTDVERSARRVAGCADDDRVRCGFRVDKSPFAQTFEFQMMSGVVTVRCARSAILVGAYTCAEAK